MIKEELIRLIAELYDISPLQVKPISQKVYKIETENQDYILKCKSSIDELKQEVELLEILRRNNINTSIPILNRNLKHYITFEDYIYTLSLYLYGDVVDDIYSHPNKQVLLRHYGQSLAKLHNALKIGENLVRYKESNVFRNVFHFIEVIQKHEGESNYQDLILYLKEHEALYDDLPKQLIHRDYHPNNILVIDDEVSGIIDFDLSVCSARLFDVVYFLTAILSAAYEDEILRGDWLQLIQYYLRGYNEINTLTEVEMKSLKLMMLIIQLTFAGYFYTHKQVELGHKNLMIANWLLKQEIEFHSRSSIMIEVTESLPEEEVQQISQALKEHNELYTGKKDFKDCSRFIIDDENQLTGGIDAVIIWDYLHINKIWVKESKRLKGYGTNLLRSVFREALKSNVTNVSFNTNCEELKDFFIHKGFEITGTLLNRPQGYAGYFMYYSISDNKNMKHQSKVKIIESHKQYHEQLDQIWNEALNVSFKDNSMKSIYSVARVNDQLIGGLIGYTGWDWFYISTIWVNSMYRNERIGSRILKAAENYVKKHYQINNAFLGTTDFQAKTFYAKQGYEVFNTNVDLPKGYHNYSMKKEHNQK